MENEFTKKNFTCIKECNTKIATISDSNIDRIELEYKTIVQNGSMRTFNFFIDIKPRNGDLIIKLPYADNQVNYNVFIDRIKQILKDINKAKIYGNDITDLLQHLQTVGILKETPIIFDEKENTNLKKYIYYYVHYNIICKS